MNKVIKILITSIALIVVVFIWHGLIRATFNGYAEVGLVNLLLLTVGVVMCSYFMYDILKKMWTLIIIAVFFSGCQYAKSNQQVVVSTDCGMEWKQIQPGSTVPKGGINPCYMKVVIPNYPMQGESHFIANLKNTVRATVHIDYDYSIVNPLSFIKQAKFLGKANVDADSEEAISSSFEGAENMVIDKRLKEVSKSILIESDIVDVDQSDLEDKLLEESNEMLEKLGVHLNFITLTFDLDEQTRLAIDVATAMKIYQSKNLEEIGKQVIPERAGATKVTVENYTTQKTE